MKPRSGTWTAPPDSVDPVLKLESSYKHFTILTTIFIIQFSAIFVGTSTFIQPKEENQTQTQTLLLDTNTFREALKHNEMNLGLI